MCNQLGWHPRLLSRRIWHASRYENNNYAPITVLRAIAGTSIICSFLEIGMSFVPPRVLKRIFPPMVTGTVILMIGASLIGSSGILNWGGGSGTCSSLPTTGEFTLCPSISAPRPLPYVHLSVLHLTTLLKLVFLHLEQMGLGRVHRSWVPLLRQHHHHGAVRLAVHEEHQYHHWPGRGLHRRRRCWLHRREQHHYRACYHVLVVCVFHKYASLVLIFPAGCIHSRSESIPLLFCLCWLSTVCFNSRFCF